MDFVDHKYIQIISPSLSLFKKKGQNLYNFRCPICGDSQKNKTKARGYLYQVKNNTNFKCHNCGINISFNNFLKKVDPIVYKNYSLEKFKEGYTGKNFPTPTPEIKFKPPKFTSNEVINVVSQLPKASENDKAKKYLEKRKLDPDKFYYAEKFKEWTNSIIKTFDKKSLFYEEPRIIIPLIYNKQLIGYQGRSIETSQIKYITIMLDDDSPKVYGFDNVNVEDPVYVLEGPFDSYFVKNSIAMCGADVNLNDLNISHPVYIYDNEPRNKEIHSRMLKQIDKGGSIVVWPSYIEEKDVNDMVLSGLNVQSVIESNIYSGLEAKLKFITWKKV